jgi:hypothetical protein
LAFLYAVIPLRYFTRFRWKYKAQCAYWRCGNERIKAFISNKVLNLIKEIIKLVTVMTAVDWWKSRQVVLPRAT